MTLSPSKLVNFVHALAGRRTEWERLVRHSPDGRIFEQVWDDEAVNAWLICWSELQDTGWHDHDESAAAILVLDGEIREERLRVAAAPVSRVMRSGTSFYVPSSAIHRVQHAGSRPAVTLHAYSPPLSRTGAYWLGPDGDLQRLAQPYEQELRAVAAT